MILCLLVLFSQDLLYRIKSKFQASYRQELGKISGRIRQKCRSDCCGIFMYAMVKVLVQTVEQTYILHPKNFGHSFFPYPQVFFTGSQGAL